MKVLLSRWQFGVTITYHFLFVPLTIGLALLVAVMQVLAYTRKEEAWERLSRFFGTLFLINFAMGTVTGIVQEFQFGMNWSNYSVFVGNIFGAPLAMEGLLAFFLESTFIGLWLFGRNRLPPLVHTISICVVSLGTVVIVSAWALWRSRRGGKPFELGRWTLWVLVGCIAAPFLANTFGWLFTEMGRQPWIVYGLMETGAGVSPGVSATDMAVTLGGFVLLYTVLGAIDVALMVSAARRGLGTGEELPPPGPPGQAETAELVY